MPSFPTSAAADLVMLNANVLTMDPARPRAQAAAIGGGRVLAVGSNEEVRAWVNPGVVVRDLAHPRAADPGGRPTSLRRLSVSSARPVW